MENLIKKVTEFIASVFQVKIFDFVKQGAGSAIIKAVAGSGKTTTIVKALELIDPSLAVLFLAFNKSIAMELASRVPKHVLAKTFHSLGMAAWLKYAGRNVKVDSAKIRNILFDMLTPRQSGMYAGFVIKLVGLAKNAGMGYLVQDIDAEWIKLIDFFDMQLDHEESNEMEAIEFARKALRISNDQGMRCIDYDDMLFLPLINNLNFPQYDVVMVDESQDTNLVQQAILKRVVKPSTGRLIAVGDENQAIYGFRGADSDAMQRLAEAFNCTPLDLSVCYRSARKIIEKAQQYVPEITWAKDAPEGKVETLAKYNGKTFLPTDAILCRNTAPLVELAYVLIASGVGVRILGREIGKGLINLIKKLNAKGIDHLHTKLDAYEAREVAKLMSKGQDTKAEAITDRVACVRFIVESLKETDRTIPALIAAIEALFTDNGVGLLTFCTVHKSKGLEWERVYILDFEKYMPSKWAKRDWQKRQEKNLIYVAITRAKMELYFISSAGMERSK